MAPFPSLLPIAILKRILEWFGIYDKWHLCHLWWIHGIYGHTTAESTTFTVITYFSIEKNYYLPAKTWWVLAVLPFMAFMVLNAHHWCFLGVQSHLQHISHLNPKNQQKIPTRLCTCNVNYVDESTIALKLWISFATKPLDKLPNTRYKCCSQE